jgi:LPS-assembly protein
MAQPAVPRIPWAAIAVATALAAATPASAIEEALRIDLPRIGPDDIVDLEADALDYDRRAGRVVAAGDVRLAVEGVNLTSNALVLDLEGGFAEATGDVVLEYGPRRLLAERLRLNLHDDWAMAEQARLVIIDPRTRRMRLRLDAEELVREGPDRFVARRLRFTPCACPDGAPASWSLTARRATVVPDEGAWLIAPVLRVREVPVLPLPAFYLPLGDRRTGLLAPRFGYSGRNGLRLALPYHVVLGRSYDLTLTAGWYGGVDTWEPRDETVAPARPGVRGFDQALEVRWVPARRTRGAVTVTHLYDLNRDRLDPEAPERGSRGTLRATHTSRFDRAGFGAAGHGAHLNANLLSDAALLGDLQPTLERSQVGYLRSAARLHATPAEQVSVEVASRWTQDVRSRFIGPAAERRVRPLFGPDAPDTPQLLPHVHSGLAPVPLAGRLQARGDLQVLSWQRPFGEETRDPAILHVRGGSDLSHAFALGDVVAGRVAAGLRADVWQAGDPTRLSEIVRPEDAVGLAPGQTATRAYPRLEAGLHTGLERRFEGFTHRMRPNLGWRFVPTVLGPGAPRLGLDAFELAIPAAGLHQAVAGLDNELWAGRHLLARATLAQGVDLDALGLSEIELGLALSPLAYRHRLDGVMAWDWSAARISWATAQGRLVGAAGAGLQLQWTYVQPEGSARLLAGLDERFAAGALPPPQLLDVAGGPAEIHEVHFGVSSPTIRGLGLRYNVRMELSDHPRARLPQHSATVRYSSPCRCWSGAVTAVWPPGTQVPELRIQLELAGIGSVTTQPGGI